MTKGREKSDGRVVPKGSRKTARTAVVRRGGKATTVSESAGQLELHLGTADSPKGDVAGAAEDRSSPAPRAVPKPRWTTKLDLPPMRMESIAEESNLRQAWENVQRNDGAAGPDRRSIAEVREHIDELIESLHRKLLEGVYFPGMIRRVWIPKASGGQRGLGIPDVIDRIVQQAVHQVLSPHYEPTFHPSSHGFSEAATRQSPKPKSTWRKATSGWSIWTCRDSSIESITTGYSSDSRSACTMHES